MIKKGMITIAGCALSFSVMAGTMGTPLTEEYRPWSVIGSLGYTWYDNFYSGGPTADPSAQAAIGDGQTALVDLLLIEIWVLIKQYVLVWK